MSFTEKHHNWLWSWLCIACKKPNLPHCLGILANWPISVAIPNLRSLNLSRAVCGLRHRTLIINMPGSKKAVAECFEAIMPVIPHALQHINNDLLEIRKVHNSIQLSNEPSAADAVKATVPMYKHVCPHKTGTGDANDRNSPYPMVSVDDCLKLVFKNVAKLPQLTERVSDMDLPPFRASMKDGYAVKACHGKGRKNVVRYVSAGDEVIFTVQLAFATGLKMTIL